MESVVADLQRQLAKKSSFESAAAVLADLFRDRYDGAAPAAREQMYAAACRAGALLQSRYTGRGFWLAGLNLFEQAGNAVADPKQQENMRSWVKKALEFVGEGGENPSLQQQQQRISSTRAGSSSAFLFEGQLTVGAEPPPPAWLAVQTAVLTRSGGGEEQPGVDGQGAEMLEMESILQSLTPDQNALLEEAVRLASLQDNQASRRPPPASKDEVAKLPVIRVTGDVLKALGDGTECAVCREVLVIDDEMQEMPCKHYFHPPCLKPWLEEHNSCPICRHEMRTDDHEYESRKEREAEAEAERKGAANALPGLDFMYV